MAESITYKLIIDNGTPIDVGTAKTYNISSLKLQNGTHTAKVVGTCQHGNEVESNTQTFSFTAKCNMIIRFSQEHSELPAKKDEYSSPVPGTFTKLNKNDWEWSYTPTGEDDTTLKSCFYGYFNTNLDPDIKIISGTINTVKDLTFMFGGCTSLSEVTLSLPNVTNAYSMFSAGGDFSTGYLSKLEKVTLTDTDNLENMFEMFFGCLKLKNLPLFETKNVTNMYGVFKYCASIETIPEFDTSNVTTMEAMFMDCNLLKTIPQFNTSKVTNVRQMFYTHTSDPTKYFSSLEELPDLDFSNVENMSEFAIFADKLKYIPNITVTNKLLNTNHAFNNCIKVEYGAKALYDACIEAGSVTDYSNMFGSCGRSGDVYASTTIQAERAQIPTTWGGDLDTST